MSNGIIPPEAWERQKGESTKAYEAFTIYRDMGASRSCRKVAEQLGKSTGLLERWSRVHEWQKRVSAWDAEQDRLARQAQIDEIKKMRKRHTDMATAMLAKAARALTKIPDDEIKASDVSKMVDTAAKLERISRGDVGEVIEERDGGASVPIVQFYIPDNHRDGDGSKTEEE